MLKLYKQNAFTEPYIVRQRLMFCLTTPIPHNIELSSCGQNNMITSEIAANLFLLQNCN